MASKKKRLLFSVIFLNFGLLFWQVSLLNFVFLASWAFALPYSQYRPLASSVCTVWTCVIIVCKMLYQLKSINPPSYSKNCSMVIRIRVMMSFGAVECFAIVEFYFNTFSVHSLKVTQKPRELRCRILCCTRS